MQNFTNQFGTVAARDAGMRVKGGVGLNTDLCPQVAQFFGHKLFSRRGIDVGPQVLPADLAARSGFDLQDSFSRDTLSKPFGDCLRRNPNRGG